ncbi:MAG: helix-turn-helix transcriptional regulator [Albidovulum sp.]|uniref:helix-turn-helix domain-containing protein n=1 Tax=Albidovulum sp. TaxID=1872424 RepID=UPI003CAB0C14
MPHDGRRSISDRLRDAHLTPAEAAKLADLHFNTVKKILDGRRRVHPNSIIKLERALASLEGQVQPSDTETDTVVALHGNASGLTAMQRIDSQFKGLLGALHQFTVELPDNPNCISSEDIDRMRDRIKHLDGLFQTCREHVEMRSTSR